MKNLTSNKNKVKKFRPLKIPRYLPGQIKYQVIKSDLKEYNEHLYKMFTISPKVDTKPPPFHFDKYMAGNMIEETTAMRNVEKSNKKLLEKINMINRTHGRVDSFNKNANIHSSRWELKLQEFDIINMENKKLFQTLLNAKPAYTKEDHDNHWQMAKHKMGLFAKFPLVLLEHTTKDQLLQACPSISKHYETTKNTNEDMTEEITEGIIRPECFLEFKIDNGIVIGKVIVQLYSDIVPNTVDHFLNMCCSPRKMSLKNCPISKIVINKYCIVGDPTNYNGKGNTLAVENFHLRHSRAGVLSMIPSGENNEVSSQFCITFNYMPEFDEKRVVFGKITKGALILFKVSEFGTWHGKPITKLIISDCGITGETEIQKLSGHKGFNK